MERTVVRVICAIGRSGQLGLNGHLPWEGNRDREFVADVERFFEITRGHVLMAGPKTIGSVPDFARADRELFVLRPTWIPNRRSSALPAASSSSAVARPSGMSTRASQPLGRNALAL